jgi:hypothetical protein
MLDEGFSVPGPRAWIIAFELEVGMTVALQYACHRSLFPAPPLLPIFWFLEPASF